MQIERPNATQLTAPGTSKAHFRTENRMVDAPDDGREATSTPIGPKAKNTAHLQLSYEQSLNKRLPCAWYHTIQRQHCALRSADTGR